MVRQCDENSERFTHLELDTAQSKKSKSRDDGSKRSRKIRVTVNVDFYPYQIPAALIAMGAFLVPST